VPPTVNVNRPRRSGGRAPRTDDVELRSRLSALRGLAWATRRLTTYGTFMAVDGFAKQFTDWQRGDRTDAHVTLYDDGALESRACVRDALRY
jgi:hypothetical protein